MGGGVEYWMELPIPELLLYLIELADEVKAEHEAAARAARRR